MPPGISTAGWWSEARAPELAPAGEGVTPHLVSRIQKRCAVPLVDLSGERFKIDVAGPEGAPPLILSHALGTTLHM